MHPKVLDNNDNNAYGFIVSELYLDIVRYFISFSTVTYIPGFIEHVRMWNDGRVYFFQIRVSSEDVRRIPLPYFPVISQPFMTQNIKRNKGC